MGLSQYYSVMYKCNFPSINPSEKVLDLGRFQLAFSCKWLGQSLRYLLNVKFSLVSLLYSSRIIELVRIYVGTKPHVWFSSKTITRDTCMVVNHMLFGISTIAIASRDTDRFLPILSRYTRTFTEIFDTDRYFTKETNWARSYTSTVLPPKHPIINN